ncbi:MAG: hypothetical protein AVDCRST_MAG73-1299, partial [uncultured Thermomicrobiales bacterium]
RPTVVWNAIVGHDGHGLHAAG